MNEPTRLGRNDFEILSKSEPYDGFFTLSIYRIRHALYQGGVSAPLTREVLDHGEAVCCLPYDPVLDRVVLIEQFRAGPAAAGDPHPWMLEPVAGWREPGEAPESVARRESIEEAGLTIAELFEAPCFYPSPGGVAEYVRPYIGRVDLSDRPDGDAFHGLESEGEDIRIIALSLDEALALADAGQVKTGHALIVLYWLSRHRDRVRADWGV
ncbi:MAG: NUDIX domain-containing protein [Alphaproteobacteria bacterium]|nr:NUDIX domain-containing protein [Alphaproteobacteria bacterium]